MKKKTRMKIVFVVLGTMLVFFMFFGVTRDKFPAAVIDSNMVSVHIVQFGTMPFHTHGRGMITRIGANARTTSLVLPAFAHNLNLGNPAAVKIAGVGGDLSGKVARIGGAATGDAVSVEISFDQPLSPEVQAGDSADSVIEYGRIENTLYMERGFFSQANIDDDVFVLDAEGKSAIRTKVRFGVIASELIEIKTGLKKDDKVIVTDMTRYQNVDRVLIK